VEHYNQPIGSMNDDLYRVIRRRFDGAANFLLTVYTGCTLLLISGGGGGGAGRDDV
jgi:hypothetical protein